MTSPEQENTIPLNSPELAPNYKRELFDTKWKIQLNACHLADVRDAIKACNLEWDALQEERKGLLSRLVEIEQVQEYPQ